MAKARLTTRKIERLDRPGVYGDGETLYLRVRESGSRSWVQIITIDGKRTERGLGGYPLVSLCEAREIAFENRRALRRGENPFRRQLAPSGAPTFGEALEAFLEIQRQSWRNAKTEKQWRSTMRDYAMPTIGKMPVSEIEAADVLAVLKPIWESKRETANYVKQRIRAVLDWAIAEGHREHNPVDAVGAVLPKARAPRSHRKALPYADVPAAIAAVRKATATAATKLAFEFLALTAARSGEARHADWSEIDLQAATWTIPAERMKARKEHVVPLAPQAIAILEAAKDAHGDDGLVFPSQRRGKPLSDSTLGRLLKAAEVNAMPHGFRSSFRDWAAEHGVSRDIAEAALAHTVGNAVEQAYHRTTYLEQRREVMRDWAKHCEPSNSQLALAKRRQRKRAERMAKGE